MCGRYDNHLSRMHGWSELLTQWPQDVRFSRDIFPTNPVTVFRSVLGETMHWGMIAPWADEFKMVYPTFNARLETIDQKPTFRAAWRQEQRCLIPMSGYYEWPTIDGIKVKHYVTDKSTDGLVVAGLWEEWRDGALSTTMITRPADDNMSMIHPRMLCYLTPETGRDWLSGALTKEDLLGLSLPNVIFYPHSAA